MDICERINEASPNIFGNYSEENLVANRREYDLPADKLSNLKAVFLKLDGTSYVRAKWIDLNDPIVKTLSGSDPLDLNNNVQQGIVYQEAWITSHFDNNNPAVFIWRDSLFILSGTISAVTDGIQLWYSNFPDPLPNLTENTTDLSTATDSTSTVPQGLPKQFHELLARAVIIEYKGTKNIPLTGREPLFDQDLDKAIDQIRDPNLDQAVRGSLPYSDGSSFWEILEINFNYVW